MRTALSGLYVFTQVPPQSFKKAMNFPEGAKHYMVQVISYSKRSSVSERFIHNSGFFLYKTQFPTSQPSRGPWDFTCLEPKYYLSNSIRLILKASTSSSRCHKLNSGILFVSWPVGLKEVTRVKTWTLWLISKVSSFFSQQWLHAFMVSSMRTHF